VERRQVRQPLPGSYEQIFHSVGIDQFFLPLRNGGAVADALRQPMLERAIGVIYRPETERLSHYFEARLADQFDAVLHFDDTRAVEPLDRTAGWESRDAPDTYPFNV
jgi:erythromycin esterase-like protein